MTIASEITRIKTNIENAYAKAEEKGATMPELLNSENLAGCIESVPKGSGGGAGNEYDLPEGVYRIKFYDYDGTVLSNEIYSEGDTVSVPQQPSHEKLVFHAWSKNLTTVNGHENVTALYTTVENKTYLKIKLTEETGLTFDFKISQGYESDYENKIVYNDFGDNNITINVDYGDGSTTTKSLTGSVSKENPLLFDPSSYRFTPCDFIDFSHTYESYGDYYISIDGIPNIFIAIGPSIGNKIYQKPNTSISDVKYKELDTYSDFYFTGPSYAMSEVYYSSNHITNTKSLAGFNTLFGYCPNIMAVAGCTPEYVISSSYFHSAGPYKAESYNEEGNFYWSNPYFYSKLSHIVENSSLDIFGYAYPNFSTYSIHGGTIKLSGCNSIEHLVVGGFDKNTSINLKDCVGLRKVIINDSSIDRISSLALSGCPNLEYNDNFKKIKKITLGLYPCNGDVHITKNTERLDLESTTTISAFDTQRLGYCDRTIKFDDDCNIVLNFKNSSRFKRWVTGDVIIPSCIVTDDSDSGSGYSMWGEWDAKKIDLSKTGITTLKGGFKENKKMEDCILPNNLSTIDNLYYFFYGCKKLCKFSMPKNITINNTNASYMFYNCENIRQVDLTNFNVGNINNMKYMFQNCHRLNKLYLPLSIPESVDCGYMFYNCYSLTSLNLDCFSKLSENMFYGSGIEEIEINDNINTISNYAFSSCKILKKVWLSSQVDTINPSNASYSPFKGCIDENLIIYTDATEKPSGWNNYWNYIDNSKQAKVYWGATKENYRNGDPIPA